MRKRDVVGRRIVDVRLSRWYNAHVGRMETTVDAIVLDNGRELRPHAFETEAEPAATLRLRLARAEGREP